MKYPLCHCMNAFPGVTPKEKMRAFEEYLPRIRAMLPDCGGPFPAGLWLDAATVSLLKKQRLEREFADRIRSLGYCACTANAFPYGVFHGTTVKTAVYRPDWSSQDRLEYTCAAAEILALLLPEDRTGSISTLPGGYAAEYPEPEWREGAKNLLKTGDFLRRLYDRTGKRILLAVEMEPDCAWESPAQFESFYNRFLRDNECSEWIGVCYDTCHQELLGNTPGSGYRRLIDNGIPVPKIHLSAALRADGAASKAVLAKDFRDRVYLHQTRVANPDGSIGKRYADMPDALADPSAAQADWILHYHIPVYVREIGNGLSAVTNEMSAVLNDVKEHVPDVTLEIETYTYDVMPDYLKEGGREQAMARELREVMSILEGH